MGTEAKTMRKLTLLLVAMALSLLLTLPASPASAQALDWTSQFGSIRDDWTRAAASDSTGVYVGGSTANTLPGQTSSGLRDAYVRRYDPSGSVLWTRQFGTSGADSASAVVADSMGLHVAGSTGGTLPGQTSAGGPTLSCASTTIGAARWGRYSLAPRATTRLLGSTLAARECTR